MEHPARASWRSFAVRGAAGIGFGLLALAWPGPSLLALVALFAAYALLAGAAALAWGMRRGAGEERWPALLLGAVSVGAGILAILRPGAGALALVLLTGANALVSGVLDIVVALRLRHGVSQARRTAWLLALAGATSVAFGALVFAYPDAGALALVWLVGAWACASGALLVALALRMRAAAGAGRAGAERRVRPDRRMAGAG